jgi:hypothetical protein
MDTTRKPFSARGAIVDVLVSAVIPVIVFQLARRFGAAEVPALGYAAILPAAIAVGGLVRRRAALDPIAILVLLGLAVSGIGFALGGGARIILIRESFFTGALGVVCLVSLAVMPRPLMFYFGRWFATQGDPAAVAQFDANWSRPGFRLVNRRITLVWGIAYLGEFAIRVAMAMTLPTAVVLAAGPLLLTVITAATIAWTFSYAGRARRRAIAAGAVDVHLPLAEEPAAS